MRKWNRPLSLSHTHTQTHTLYRTFVCRSLSIKLTHIRSAGNESSSASLRRTVHLFERREDDTRMSCEFRFEVMHFPIRWGVSGQRERKGKKEKEGGGGEKRERE